MKNMKKMTLLVMIPIIIGIVLVGVGIATGKPPFTIAGLVFIFGCSSVVVLILAVITIVKIARRASSQEHNTADEERRKIEKINSTYEYENRQATDEYMVSHVSENYRNASHSDKVKSAILVAAFIGCLIGGVVLLAFGLNVPGIIVFCCAFLLIIGAIVIVKIKEKISLSTKYDRMDYVSQIGEVKSCTLSSSSSVISGVDRNRSKQTTRITSVVYRVTVEIRGVEYVAYSRQFYNVGDFISVLLHKDGKNVKIEEEVSL